jgi:hypothetical protein
MISKEKKSGKSEKILKVDSSPEPSSLDDSLLNMKTHQHDEPNVSVKSNKTAGINKLFGIKSKKELSKTTDNLVADVRQIPLPNVNIEKKVAIQAEPSPLPPTQPLKSIAVPEKAPEAAKSAIEPSIKDSIK